MITIVTGLPRSGTSMMMRMLAAGGMPVLVDRSRPPDEYNPRGYYEFAPVKRTARDARWLDRAEGRAVKVISMLLPALPADRHYRVIFMRRGLDAVLASQENMLRRQARRITSDRAALRAISARHIAETIAWLKHQPQMRLLVCDYEAILKSPQTSTARIANFLGGKMNASRMASVIDPSLHHAPVRMPR